MFSLWNGKLQHEWNKGAQYRIPYRKIKRPPRNRGEKTGLSRLDHIERDHQHSEEKTDWDQVLEWLVVLHSEGKKGVSLFYMDGRETATSFKQPLFQDADNTVFKSFVKPSFGCSYTVGQASDSKCVWYNKPLDLMKYN